MWTNLEKIQRRAVKVVSGLTSKDYDARLKELDMLSLEIREECYMTKFRPSKSFVGLMQWTGQLGSRWWAITLAGSPGTPATLLTLCANRLEVRPGGHSLASEWLTLGTPSQVRLNINKVMPASGTRSAI